MYAIRSYYEDAYLQFESDSLVSGEIWTIGSSSQRIAYSNQIGQLFVSKLETTAAVKLPES